MDYADIRNIKPTARRDEAERIYSQTRQANMANGDNAWAGPGGSYDPYGYRSRQDRAHELASAAVDRFLSNGKSSRTPQTATENATAAQSAERDRIMKWTPPAPVVTAPALTTEEPGAVDWNAAFGKAPATSRPEEQTLHQTDAVGWDAAFGSDSALAPPSAVPALSDAMWDEAFGKQPARSAAAPASSDTTEFSWDETIARHHAEQSTRPRY